MKKVVLALIVGLVMGYHWGYGDGNDGKSSIVSRTLDRFGTSKVKAAQDARERKVEDASRP
ncbi:MAG: hypothetical protein JWM41_3561 [Gemmatimonadetes bacterium]|nr:hypothetical protein [Gemmatimonadota bacterium]